jgi:hypothetical protein
MHQVAFADNADELACSSTTGTADLALQNSLATSLTVALGFTVTTGDTITAFIVFALPFAWSGHGAWAENRAIGSSCRSARAEAL